MPSFFARLSEGLHRASEHLLLVLVPILFALLDTNKITAITTFDGGHIGFKLGLPLSVITVWQFVSVPNSGVSVNTGLPIELLPFVFLTVPLLVIAQAAIQAGYFGSLSNALDDEPYAFLLNSRTYFLSFLVLTAIPYLVLVPLAVGVFGVGSLTGSLSGAALLLILPALGIFLIVAYLFYGTPYLIVLRDGRLVDAARASYALAIEGGPYLTYAIGFSLFVFVVSPVATGIVVNVPALGLLVGILAGGFIGLGLNFATMQFFADIAPSTPTDLDSDRERTNQPF
ncbi:hypothetical protein [Halobellus sp. GM3]|uniref:hypothetical protein n=1 Tax=Halobellus sp. GM3 TaxID=3458410 RepID=UPI00403E33D0